jgi:hypothetical protein
MMRAMEVLISDWRAHKQAQKAQQDDSGGGDSDSVTAQGGTQGPITTPRPNATIIRCELTMTTHHHQHHTSGAG